MLPPQGGTEAGRAAGLGYPQGRPLTEEVAKPSSGLIWVLVGASRAIFMAENVPSGRCSFVTLLPERWPPGLLASWPPSVSLSAELSGLGRSLSATSRTGPASPTDTSRRHRPGAPCVRGLVPGPLRVRAPGWRWPRPGLVAGTLPRAVPALHP